MKRRREEHHNRQRRLGPVQRLVLNSEDRIVPSGRCAYCHFRVLKDEIICEECAKYLGNRLVSTA